VKVLQVPYGFHPDPVGGTEIYVESLSRNLQELGFEIVVAAPGASDSVYRHGDLLVHRYAVGEAPTLEALYGQHDPAVSRSFARVLDEQQPDVVHLHAFTRGISMSAVREAKRRHLPTVFTYHTPTVSCQRGTLMRWGTEVCDGFLDLNRCTACTLQGLGLPRALAEVTGRLPVSGGKALGKAGLSGGLWTALRMRELVDLRHGSFRALMNEVDHIVTVCDWVNSVLLVNGVPPAKITLSRHGLDDPSVGAPSVPGLTLADTPIRVAYLGRMDRVKGVHLLVEALRALPKAHLELHVYGVIQGASGEAYSRFLHELAEGDSRIVFHPPVSSDQSVSVLREYHALAVPSQWLETGPLVVLEAFAAGIPVIGSDLGGIAELVEHEVNGLLVPPHSVPAWSDAFRRLLDESTLVGQLRAGVQAPRTMRQVADEMLHIYEHLLVDPAIGMPKASTGASHA
jgi:glycosyltransferase involved in cell wall biosynthesis